MKCPECEASLEMVSLCDEDSGLTMILEPDPGQLLQAKTIGGVLSNLHDLFVEIGKEQGVKVDTLVRGLNSNAEGKIEISLTIAKRERVQPELKRCPDCKDEYSGAFCPCSYEVQDDEPVQAEHAPEEGK